jgi:hypothetical protein
MPVGATLKLWISGGCGAGVVGTGVAVGGTGVFVGCCGTGVAVGGIFCTLTETCCVAVPPGPNACKV